MTARIAIVGMACRYPDARSPSELWENVLAQRRAFRRMPDERLRLADYLSADREAPDSFYSTNAAVIEGYEFDRLRFRVAGSTFRSADLAHWLALDVAAQALVDAGFTEAEGLPRETTGVFLGNTLTGEFSRANTLRLRWPYVRRTLEANLVNEDWSVERRGDFLRKVEATYKEPFPPIGEESLAGGLSNTIAGRICNYFDLQGGGYTVDGACASSLLAVANACTALTSGDLDVALAGGVDLSLDPFELVGFAKAGALATDEMRVYDVRSNGFWPGEGCGFVLLMRYEDALAQHLRIYAVVRGWGISSDGNGGITRPEVDGQLLALRRAYARAGFGIETVDYFEGHGTGTSVGDSVELHALSRARREANGQTFPAAIGTIKAHIGHTKAAAGIAGLIKTALALQSRIIPPTTGCEEPHAEFRGQSPALRTLKTGEAWPKGEAVRAGVSSMGFGGINAHVVIEAAEPETRRAISVEERALMASSQDAELFLLGALSADKLQSQIDHLLTLAARLSRAELSDLASHLESTLDNVQVRAAVVASTPADLVDCLEQLRTVVTGERTEIDPDHGVFFGTRITAPRIGFLFPGQGSPSHLSGGALCRRFDFVREIYAHAQLDEGENETATSTAQPAIVTASIAALRVLDRLEIAAQVAVGHSLGELTALHWAGAMNEESLFRIARVRGQAMMKSSTSPGAMASIGAGAQEVLALLNGELICVAGLNSPTQTVISGEVDAVEEVMARALAKNLSAVKLAVSHAFHSALVAPAGPVLTSHLSNEHFKPLRRPIVSTVTGEYLRPETNLAHLLSRQITSPVRFMEAVTEANNEAVDLWLEVGPGHVLRGIMSEITETPVISLDAGGDSLRGLLCATGAAFVLGHPVNHRALFAGRFTRPFDLDWRPKFFVNPCELAPVPETMAEEETKQLIDKTSEQEIGPAATSISPNTSVLELVTRLVAERAELPASAVDPESRLLSDLHLNSITVSQLVAEATRHLHLPRPVSPTDFADVTVAEVAQALEEQLRVGQVVSGGEADVLPAGIDSWVRPYRVELVERALPRRSPLTKPGRWQVLAPPDDPFAESLRRKFAECEVGNGIVLCLPPEPDEMIIAQLLEAARLVLEEKESPRLVLVQRGWSVAAFARTLHLEAPRVTTCVLNVPKSHKQAADWVIAEVLAADGYVEAHYDDDGRRYEPVVRPLPFFNRSGDLLLSTADVLVVTGGGKGITAECALALAKESDARLVLVGQAQPESDEELSLNLKRMTAAGIDFRYISADVTDAAQVRELVQRVEKEFGPITGILHGAARNVPQLISGLDEETFRRTLAVKVQGARHLLAAVNPERLRLLITFGSIIARTGLPGEADYGLANEWLTQLCEEWKTAHPSCRCLAVEWSIWSGKGMGERLGRADRLMQQGIVPIPPDEGVAMLRNLLCQSLPAVSVVVMGRFGDLPTFKIERAELPFLRFMEQPQVYYPNVELVVDDDLSTTTDPYLNDHVFQGERLLPAVIGLEAMAQAAMAVVGSTEPPIFEKVSFNQPVIAPETGTVKIRLAALVRGPGIVEVALRSEETAFQVNHFEATCLFEGAPARAAESNFCAPEPNALNRLPIDPQRDLYGGILFQSGRFSRLNNYRVLRAKECVAEITPDGNTEWFNRYLPGQLVLGDPGARDAALHSIQACIPHSTLLPIGIQRLTLYQRASSETLFVHARECSRDDNTFTYNLTVIDADGRVHERWEGLRLRAVADKPIQGPWVESLLGPYIERRVQELIPGTSMSVVLVRSAETDRHARSDRAIQMALGEEAEILRRPDGKPEVNGGRAVSASHSGDLTLAVAGSGQVSCDLETVIDRPTSDWLDLLGQDRYELARFSSRTIEENRGVSATRVWIASECLKKIGAMPAAPLVFFASPCDEWILFSSGHLIIASYVTQMRQRDGQLALAVLINRAMT
jgi:enediyne polyketide synthase